MASGTDVVTQQESPLPAPPPSIPGIGVLLDLAEKRLKAQDQAFDAINTRAGSLFGFTSLLLAAAQPVLRPLAEHSLVRYGFSALYLALWGFMAFNCWRAFRVSTICLPPNPLPLFQLHYDEKPEEEVKYQAFGTYVRAFVANEPRLASKAKALERAFGALIALVFSLIIGAVYSHVGTRFALGALGTILIGIGLGALYKRQAEKPHRRIHPSKVKPRQVMNEGRMAS
jgi:hypothetical protein